MSRLDKPSAAAPAADAAAFAAAFREHAPHIWRVVRGLGVREADIEDVCQDVFVVVHRKLSTFEGRSSLRTWIHGIALRVVSDYRKKAHRTHERLLGDAPVGSVHAVQEESAAQRQAWQMLDRLLDQLSEERRQVFVLYELEQLPMREVAAILDCPLQTAYSRLEAARVVVQRGMAAWREREKPP
jgi:RNA polymerase sigma-70 factor (ECF subfamily)